jgi:hypothetical protein
MSVATSRSPSPSLPRGPLLALAIWALFALGIAASGVISIERALVVPISLISSLTALLVVWRRVASVRELVARADVRSIVALHIIRAPIGAAFLWLYARGELVGDFAQRAGYGDIVAGVLALALLTVPGAIRKPALMASWNVIGLFDLVIVVLTAQRHIVFGDPSALRALMTFPFGLLPIFLVPLMIGTHVMLFTRLRAAKPNAA